MLYPVIASKDLAKTIPEGMTVFSVSRNDGKKGKSGIVCVAPGISEAVRNVFVSSAEGVAFVQDQMEWLKSKVISAIHAKGNTVHDENTGITAILAQARLETESQRMTKEAIEVWFDADLAPLVAGRITAKMVGIAADKVEKLVAGYKGKFASLSGRDVSLAPEVKAQMLKALELLPEDYDHVIAVKVAEKLNSISEATETLAAL